MKTMHTDVLMHDIVESFPEIAQFVADIPQTQTAKRLEAFADLTTTALSKGNAKKAKQYLIFIAEKLNKATDYERDFINAYYVRHLFWQASELAVEEGWPRLPQMIKKMYLDFHGAPPG